MADLSAELYGNPEPQDNGGYGAIFDGLSPKDQAEMKMKIYNEAVKRIDSVRAVTDKGRGVLDGLNQFVDLNKKSRTGGLWEAVAPGAPIFHGEDENAMKAITNRIAPSMRVEGSGTTSDRDIALMLSGLPSIEQRGSVNQQIRDQYQTSYDKALRKQTFLSDYLNKNGHLNGADEAWSQMNDTAQPKQSNSVDLRSLAAQELAKRKGRK